MNTEVEYGINVVSSTGVQVNPFDENFGTEEEAVEAGEQYLRENAEEKKVAIFRAEYRNNECVRDESLSTISRDDLLPQRAYHRHI